MPRFWLDAFTAESWDETRVYGFRVLGFHKSRHLKVGRMEKGDLVFCWIKVVHTLVGAVQVTGEPYLSYEPKIWTDGLYPARVSVTPLLTFTADQGCDLNGVLSQMSFYDADNMHRTWSHFRGSPNELQEADGRLLLSALEDHHRDFA